jgi:hypothetical protein
VFNEAVFEGDVQFDSVVFEGDMFFHGAQFKGNTNFSGSQFSESAWFCDARFVENQNFSGTKFHSACRFENAVFEGDLSFHGAVFEDQAIFESIIANRGADFTSCHFKCGCNFRNGTFLHNSNFQNVTMQSAREGTFNLQAGYDINLQDCSFAHMGDFSNCRVLGKVKLAWPGESVKLDNQREKIWRGILCLRNIQFNGDGILDLRDNYVTEDEYIRIEHCDMSRILLQGTDCTKLDFYDNVWHSVKDNFPFLFGLGISRDIIGDESYACEGKDEQPKWHLIRQTYQQLARRFREQLDHPRANEFDRGTFEMRWKEVKSGSCDRSFIRRLSTGTGLFIYRYISHYSGSMVLPLFWLVITTILFGLAYASAVNKDFIDILADTLRVVSVGKVDYEYLGNAGYGVELLKLAQKVTAATLVTLFIFSVRRRFKH